MSESIRVAVRLHGGLRDRVPRADKGRISVELAPAETVATLLAALDLLDQGGLVVAVNEVYEADFDHALHDGDKVSVFSVIGGGRPI